MEDRWRETFLGWAQTPEHRQRVALARSVIRETLASHALGYLAYSGGKDSSVMLHLVIEQAPDTMVWHAWSIWRPLEIEERIEAMAREMGVRNYETSRGLGERFTANKLPELQRRGFDLVFVGLREEESGRRRRRMRAGQSLYGMDESWPLALWTWMDVWAYLVANGLPWLEVYDQEAAIVGWDQVRFSTFHEPSRRAIGVESVQGALHWRMLGAVGQNHPWKDKETSLG